MKIMFKTFPFLSSWYKKYQVRKKSRFRGPASVNRQLLSSVFDNAYYLSANPDVAAAGIDPFQHFCESGWREGRNPHPLFSTLYYLQSNPDVMQSGVNPLEHYLSKGWLEGRDPHPVFDAAYYSKAGWYSTQYRISPLEYYLRYRCAATGTQLPGLDALMPPLQDKQPASFPAKSMQQVITPLISILMHP